MAKDSKVPNQNKPKNTIKDYFNEQSQCDDEVSDDEDDCEDDYDENDSFIAKEVRYKPSFSKNPSNLLIHFFFLL